MDKREFLKKSGVAVVGSMMPRIGFAATRPEGTQKNWAGNLTYSTDRLEQPGTVDELRTAMGGSTHVKALGARHSFKDDDRKNSDAHDCLGMYNGLRHSNDSSYATRQISRLRDRQQEPATIQRQRRDIYQPRAKP